MQLFLQKEPVRLCFELTNGLSVGCLSDSLDIICRGGTM